ncbi:dTMP kinase [Actinospica durhamensis]|uniref:Thymidylate kinase n=1 Tax=Actinospica durhamensis TaxID=1508375 RepID=A0A941EUJ1_9ACTN|nr:dTMP kinase [Actinospica durhamensis]MBR7835314.1 dTMP kinase [Actinospica durhamensis]
MVGKLRGRRWRPGGPSRVAGGPERAYAGWFIAVEGGDGVGKSTQISAVAAWLRGRGFEVVTTREPGGTPLGDEVRNLVLHAREHRLGARAEALLFAADRADHMETVVRPALERGAVVLTDRHVDSSVAYQSGGRGLAAEDVVALSAFATDGVRPDLVVLLDLDPAVARARREERTGVPDKLEAEAGDFHERVRATFLARSKQDPERYLVIDANQGPQILTGAIQDRLDGLLPLSAEETEAAAKRAAALAAAIAREREFQQARVAEEAEARATAEAEDRRAREEELAERQAAEQERLRAAAKERSEREAAEQEARSHAEAEQSERTETQRREADRREQELRIQSRQDALRRREAELAVRQAEARAKERARLAAAAAKAAQEQARQAPSLTDDLMRLGGLEPEESGAVESSVVQTEPEAGGADASAGEGA